MGRGSLTKQIREVETGFWIIRKDQHTLILSEWVLGGIGWNHRVSMIPLVDEICPESAVV